MYMAEQGGFSAQEGGHACWCRQVLNMLAEVDMAKCEVTGCRATLEPLTSRDVKTRGLICYGCAHVSTPLHVSDSEVRAAKPLKK